MQWLSSLQISFFFLFGNHHFSKDQIYSSKFLGASCEGKE